MYRRKGLGATFTDTFPTDFLGYQIPCDQWFNWAGSPSCWKHSLSEWQQIANQARSGSGTPFTTSDIQAPAAVPLAYTDQPVYSGNPGDMSQYNQQTSDVLNAAMVQTQANLLRAAQSDVAAGPANTGFSWWIVAAIGGVFLLGMAVK